MAKTRKQIDSEKLERYLEKGDFASAKKIISNFIDQDLDPAEKGRIYTETLAAYLELTNKVNQEYLNQIKETTAALKDIREHEKQDGDTIRKMEIEESLKHPDHDDDDL